MNYSLLDDNKINIKFYLLDENKINIKFYLLDENKKEFECGIIYDLSHKKPKLLDRYITVPGETEEVVINEL